MNFVTKKDFEAALAVIKCAASNGQITEGRIIEGVSQRILTNVFFGDNLDNDFKPEQIMFILPLQAAKNRLHSLQEELKKQRENTTKSQKVLENLEKEEEKLRGLLPTLKE